MRTYDENEKDEKPVSRPRHRSLLDEEFDAAVRSCALVDLTSFGRIEVTGKDALDLMHRLSTNELLSLRPGYSRRTVFTTEKGRIVDSALVLSTGSGFLLIISTGAEENLSRWIEKFTITEDVSLNVVTPSTSMYSLIGPAVGSTVTRLTGRQMEPGVVTDIGLQFGRAAIALDRPRDEPVSYVIIDRKNSAAAKDALLDAGRDSGLKEMGQLAYELYRISRGIPRSGAEISEAFNPLEAGLHEAVSFTKGCYIGQEVIARLDTYQKGRRKLVGVILPALRAQSVPMPVLRKGNVDVGFLTSWAQSPVHGKYLGLAIVSGKHVVAGDSLEIGSPGDNATALVTDFPIPLT